MKKRAILLIICIILSCVYTLVPRNVKAASTLGDTMWSIISANSWTPTSFDPNAPHYATIFSVGSPSYYQVAAQLAASYAYPDEAIHNAEQAIMDGFPSAVSQSTIDSLLNNQAMVGALPADWMSQYWLTYHRWIALAYSYGNSRWNAQAAIDQVNSIVTAGGASSPHTYIGYSLNSGYPTYYRYYDDTAETIEWLLEMGKYGTTPISTVDMIWNFQQSYFWNGLYYGYNGQSTMETEVGPFALISGRYLVTRNLFDQYGSRIVSDLNQKLLVNGYSSPLWNHYSLNHVPGYDERRLENALAAWAAMQAYYPVMTSTMQATLRSMCGVGWQGLLTESGDYDATTKMFRWWATSSVSNAATGGGLMYLFLNGIVPQTGSLAIPLNDEWYEDTASWSPATMFNFNYNAHTIKIPVNPGTINFIFGSGTATYTFPNKGVYVVQFSSDWNTVTSANYMGALDSAFKYVPTSNSPPPQYGSIFTQATTNSVSVPFEAWVDSGAHVQVPVSGYTFGNVLFGSHTVYGLENGTQKTMSVTVNSEIVPVTASFTFDTSVTPPPSGGTDFLQMILDFFKSLGVSEEFVFLGFIGVTVIGGGLVAWRLRKRGK